MPDYQNGKIYSIRSPNNEKYYIGSTTQKLHNRMAGHRTLKNNGSSKEIINSGGAYIELIENFSCNNKEELLKREGELIRKFKNDIVNMIIPNRTHKEYIQDNKDKIKKYMDDYSEQYYKNNKEQILINGKEKFNCNCGSINIRKAEKARHYKSIKHIKYLQLQNIIL